MSTTLTQAPRTGEYIVGEEPDYRSRDVAIITGGNFESGTVLGKITASGKLTQVVLGATDGSQNAVAILYQGARAATVDRRRTVHSRACSVNGNLLIYPTGSNASQQQAIVNERTALGIIVRV